MRTWVAFIGMFLLVESSLFAQHSAIQSQYLLNDLVINPASAGKNEALSFAVSHRNQWSGIEGAPVTTAATIHGIVKNEKVGVGLMLYNDRLGINNNNSITGVYAYRIRSGKVRISFGLQGGALFTTQKWSDVATTSPNDDAIPPNSTFVRPIIGSGVQMNRGSFFVGLSVPQLLSFRTSTFDNSKYYRPYLLTFGNAFMVSQDLTIKPSVLFKYIKNSPVQADLNLLLSYRSFLTTGVSYRTKNTLVLLCQSQLNPQLSLGYSYDHFFGQIGNYSRGAHEFVLSYVLSYQVKAKGARSF